MPEGNSAPHRIARLNESVHRLGPLGSPRVLSSYLIIDEKISLVDCGPSSVVPELAEMIQKAGVSPSEMDYLLLTHVHLDHAGGAAAFLRHFPHAKVMIPKRGFKHMLDPSILNESSRTIIGEKIFDRWGACEPVPPDRAISIPPFAKINLGHSEIEYVPAPGHAPHHHILHLQTSSILFAADSIGIMDAKTDALIPTTPPPSFDFEKAMHDISAVEKLAPRLDCIAHFEEAVPNAELFARVREVYTKWGAQARDFVSEKRMDRYDLEDCEELFTRLEIDFPEYSRLSPDLREQSIRIDCAGMLDYCIRHRGPLDRDNPDLSAGSEGVR